MKERPILFSGEMVRAILDGRKTQTRRVIKTIPCQCGAWTPYEVSNKTSDGFQTIGHSGRWSCESCSNEAAKCPYGAPGDRLWVRETWATPGNYDHTKPSELNLGPSTDIVFRSTEKFGDAYFKWRPSIFMPRSASRILLEITNVRVERINDISINDVFYEGTDIIQGWDSDDVIFAKFIELWDSINAKRGYSWESNPWVWVIEFKMVKEQK